MAFTRRKTLLFGLWQNHYRATNPGGRGERAATERCGSVVLQSVVTQFRWIGYCLRMKILAKVERMSAQEREAAVTITVTHGNGGHERGDSADNSIASRLRQFAFLFKRRS